MKPALRLVPALVALLPALLAPGCHRAPEVTPTQRRQAALLASEADFALTLRHWAEAEGKLAQATALDPEDGEFWLALGTTRMRLSRREDARAAYKASLAAFAAAAARNPQAPEPVLREIHVLALLGRVSEARTRLGQARSAFPDHRAVRSFAEEQLLDRMLADPGFKELSL